MPEQLPTVPSAQSDEPTVQKKRKESSLLLAWWMRLLLFFRTWMGWLTIGFLATFAVVTTTIPVGRIPFLRNVVYAMGYSSEEAMNLTFFKAFLGWNEHAKIARGELPDPNAILVFGKDGGFLDAANRKGAAASSLINFKQLNAAQLRKGGKLGRANIIAGVVGNEPGADNELDNIALKGSDISAQTQANQAGVSEVFFGDEVGMIKRGPKDAYNSTQNLKRLASAKGIMAGSGTNTLGLLIDRAIKVDSDIDSILQAMDSSGSFGSLGTIAKLGSENPNQEDLYYAWLLSRAARRARQASLQKKLASMAYMGGELPRSVFVMSGSGGLGFNPDEFEADMERMKDYLEQDKKCNAAIDNANTKEFQESMVTMADSIKALVVTEFPKDCETVYDHIRDFNNKVTAIVDSCEKMKNAYERIGKECGVEVRSVGLCQPPTWNGAVSAFSKYCTDKFTELDNAIKALETQRDDLSKEIDKWAREVRDREAALAIARANRDACTSEDCIAAADAAVVVAENSLNEAKAEKEKREKERDHIINEKLPAAEKEREDANGYDWKHYYDDPKGKEYNLGDDVPYASNEDLKDHIQATYYDDGFDVEGAGEGERGHLREGYFPTMTGWGNQGRNY